MHQSSASSLSSRNLKKKTEKRKDGWLREIGRPFPFISLTMPVMIKNETDLGPTKELARPVKSSATRSSLLKVLLLLPVFFLRSTS